ncbi:MAG TPA: AAA family ATPase, partial [Planctomycetaceae bacterium]|nr:AAA family ATPase [Planctomycetaceae bacterium]
MKLAEIQIDRCGIWRDLTLPLNPQGLNVLFGPNEAGKSTLLSFVRGVLYGFSPDAEGAARDRNRLSSTDGSLLLEGAGGARRVRRSAAAGTRGVASVIGEGHTPPANELLADALQGIDEQAFRTLFAIDLRQLQELGVLTGDEAAARIYDVSLGPDGRRLIEACRRADVDRHRFVDPLQQDGELVRLFEQHDQLEAQLHELDRHRQQHEVRCAERDRLKQDLADLERRQAGIREQLRGHLFLERAWGPWQQLRTGRRELDALPVIIDFPERGLERLERLETEIAAAAEARDRSLSAAKQCRRRLEDSAVDNPLYAQAGVAQGFVEQRG